MALTKIRGNTQIQNLSITNAQIALPDASNPDGILLTKIQDGDLLVKSDGSVAFTAPVSGVAPTQDNHLVTKGYVDAAAQGLDVKDSVRVVAQDNVALSGIQTIDGVALNAGDRVLLTGQTNNVENGIYVVAAGGWTRSPDATTAADVTPGLFTFVEEGTVAAGTGWVLTSTGPTTLGTTPLPFAQFSSAGVTTAGDGLAKTGNTFSVVSGNGGIAVSADAITLTLDGTTLSVSPDGLKLADLPVGQVLIGNASGVATAREITGDVTIDENGVASISPGAIGAASITDGSLALGKLTSGTAGQVIVAGTDGVPAYTTIGGDATLAADGTFTLSANSVGSAELADGAVGLTKLAAVPTGQIIMGTAAGNATVTLSGDVTITEGGVVSINPATVVRVADIIKRENPTGNIDGVNDTYVLANAPKVGTVDLYINGILQDEGAGNDYTIAGDTITMLYLLTTGDKIRVSYIKA